MGYKLYLVFTLARYEFIKKNCLKSMSGDIIKSGSVQRRGLIMISRLSKMKVAVLLVGVLAIAGQADARGYGYGYGHGGGWGWGGRPCWVPWSAVS